MTKRILSFLFLLCLLMGIPPVNEDGFSAPISNELQYSNQRSISHTNPNNLIEVVKSESHFLIMRFRLPRLEIQKLQQDEGSFTQIWFNGANGTTEIGKPKLPIYTVQIGLPSVSSVTATVIEKQSTFKQVEHPLITNQAMDPFFPDVQERDNLTLNSAITSKTSTSTLYPAEMIEVIPVGFVRSQRIGAVHIHPIQYNNKTQQIKITEEITFRIDFYGAPKSVPAAPLSQSLESSAYEDLFQTMLINNRQASLWRQGRGRSLHIPIQGAPAAPATTRRRFKIPITQNDMYHITYNNLKSAGVSPETIDLNSILVKTGGNEQGFYIFDEDENETLDSGDMIVFYARGLTNTKFTDTNYYWFSFAEKGTAVSQETTGTFRIGTRSAVPVSSDITPPAAFLTKLRFEEDNIHDPLDGEDVKDDSADRYFWTAFRGDGSPSSKKKFPIELPGAVSRHKTERDATFRVRLQGSYRKSAAPHKAAFFFNDKELGRVFGINGEWRRQEAPTVTRVIPQKWIVHDEVNYLLIEAKDTNDTPEIYDDFYLDWYEFDYWHTFRAEYNRLAFNSTTDPEVSGKTQFVVTNFSTDAIDVYTMNSRGLTEKLVDGRVLSAGSSYQIQFEDDVTQYTNYFVVSNRNYRSIGSLTEIPPSTLRSPTTQADYIVITHNTFLESIEPLVEFRRSQGLTVKVVDIDEIYNEFNGGVFSPIAIQTFLRYTYETWQPPAPTYVLLVGDAHYDYKRVSVKLYNKENSRGTYNLYPIFVPTYHGWAPESGETAMDQRFINVSGDDRLPDMFIGRLSVQTAGELSAMVKKIIDYEKNQKIGPWQGTIIQVSDNEVNNPSDRSFELSRDRLIKEFIPVAYDTKQIYLRKMLLERRDTRKAIIEAWNNGALVIEYAGHGGISTWADEGIFHINNVDDLVNRFLPFVITTTCLNGQFDKPQEYGNHCLSEELLHSKYGAIASLSATRLTYGQANAEFDEDLFTAMFVREPFEVKQGPREIAAPPPSIGKIVTEAKIRFITRTTNLRWILGTEQYALFGDPATRLALPTLDIPVKLSEFALNSSKNIVIMENEVGTYDINGVWWKAEDFNSKKLIASAIFQNDFDDVLKNDFTERNERGKVWQGQFGRIQMDIPSSAIPGRGVVRLFAYDDEHAAIGGTVFWVDTPIIADVLEKIETIESHTLNLQALIYDDMGGVKGIRSIEVVWDNEVTFDDAVIPMVKIAPPPETGELPPGGQWYELQKPIPLPLGGRNIRYQIVVTDTSGLEIKYPAPNKRISVAPPKGANLSIGTDGINIAPIRYTFDEKTEKYILTAELINDGGRSVKTDIDVIFAEGNPDKIVDYIIDEDAVILGRITIKPEDWKAGDSVIQRTTASLKLTENLSTGVHNIYVMVDPEVEGTDDDIKGNVAELKEYDNSLHITLIVNEFFYEPSKPLSAFSLDRVFDIDIPASAATVEGDKVPLVVSTSAPFGITQPSLSFASIPRVAALRRGLLRSGDERAQQYEVSFRAPDVMLKKPAALKLRFDVSSIEDTVRENTPWQEGSTDFKAALIEEAEKLGIYTWHRSYERWKRLPSQVSYFAGNEKPNPEDDAPIFQLENYVTPIQTENANKQPLPIENVEISPDLTPAGIWVILFTDPTQYEVYLKRKSFVHFDKLDNPGELNIPFRDEHRGIEFTIPKDWVVPPELNDGTPIVPFEFGDILIFETDYLAGKAFLKEARNRNAGNGTATITARAGPNQEFAVGDWFIFFTSKNYYELHDKTGSPVYLPFNIQFIGEVNKSFYLSHLGLEILVTSSTEEFRFGDKIKFSSAQVATITAETTDLTPFTLISSDDTKPPEFNLWIDGVKPQTGSVIAPRPLISMLLEDADGVNLDTLIIRRGDNGNLLKPISDYVLRNPKNVNTVPIDYKPILFPGEYAFEIEARDFNGNAIGGKAEKIQTRFVVIEMPDVSSPDIEILVNDEVLTGEESNTPGGGTNIGKNRITGQPRCEIRVTDDIALDDALFSITFNQISTDATVSNATRRYREFDDAIWEFDEKKPDIASFSFAPDLPNGTYRLQVTATDTSENITEIEVFFTLDEPVTLKEVFNVPNPVEKGRTFFTYQLVQPPDKVTIKIYTVSGRLIKTIADASANRGNNETFWDGKDETGIRCANGVYLYRVIAKTEEKTVQKVGKLAILR